MADLPPFVAERLGSSLKTLFAAFDYALDSHLDRWQFGVALTDVLSQGATLLDVRWLVLRGFAEHAKETTVPGDANRSFRRLPPTSLPADMCIALSPLGAETLRAALPGCRTEPASQACDMATTSASTESAAFVACVTPAWDAERREVRYRDQIVKRYRVPAPNQELILAAFEEEGWPQLIDDPLPPQDELDPKRRLQATIKSLNRNQLAPLIRFHGNGNGLQVYWEAV
ncbi:MAG TPA: hypothetical protein VGN42_21895 [Pirellulales bacterium]|jgi:hypothetical protein|nr:hypothetical protein [Pirellulales bacterium]